MSGLAERTHFLPSMITIVSLVTSMGLDRSSEAPVGGMSSVGGASCSMITWTSLIGGVEDILVSGGADES